MKNLYFTMEEFSLGKNKSDILESIPENLYLVYLIINNKNDKKYVGITSVNRFNRRMKEHIWQSFNKCSVRYDYPLYRGFRKYGLENFTVSILDLYKTADEVKENERRYINELNTYTGNIDNKGYNQTLGGDGLFGVCGEKHPMYGKRGCLSPNFGRKASDETRAKISIASKNSLNHYKFKSGKEHRNYGKPISEEMRQRLRESNLGKTIPLDVRNKISNTLKGRPGRPHSEETKKS